MRGVSTMKAKVPQRGPSSLETRAKQRAPQDGGFAVLCVAYALTAISADWIRFTRALAISAQALASEPWVSMPRQASSTT